MLQYVLEDVSRIPTLVKDGHKIGSPAPIFRPIPEEEVNKWKEEFGGGRDK
jgi:hypothetical protein